MSRIRAFTLIELLIVIAIIAILGSATVLVLNPLELMRQSRDGTRINDTENIQKSIAFTLFNNPSLIDSLLATNIYLSLPSGSCPTNPPAGYTYVCNATTANINKIDGTGWIPLSLQNIAALPIDPNQNNNANDYYAFIANPATKTFVVTSLLESEKQSKASASKDGGTDPGRFEKGNVALWNGASGLVGYWNFDGNGSIANGQTTGLQDSSGNNNNGTAINTNGTGMSFVAGKINNAVQLDGVDDYLSIVNSNSLRFGTGSFSYSFWTYRTASGYQGGSYFSKGDNATGTDCYDGIMRVVTTSTLAVVGLSANMNVWDNHVLVVTQGSTPYIKHYINGVLDNSGYYIGGTIGTYGSDNYNLNIGISMAGGINRYFNGKMDDFRIYNRALTADEVLSLYNAGK